jgi:hypothetical protein
MRVVPALALVIACDAGEKRPTSSTSGSQQAGSQLTAAVVKPVPPGPYVVRYNCFHSDMPFGKGAQHRDLTVDLAAKTWTLDAWELTGEEGNGPPPPPGQQPAPEGPVHEPEVAVINVDSVAKVEAAVVAVLRGGPFKPEHPVPEGTSCVLLIEANGARLFELEKAYTKENDAATDLVKALGR